MNYFVTVDDDASTIYIENINVNELRVAVEPNDSGASFKIVDKNTTINTVDEYNNSIEASDIGLAIDTKVVVKAEDGTLKTYSVVLD